MVVRMRHTRSQRNNTRSHHKLVGAVLGACPECGALRMQHRACPNCGKYNGRGVVNVQARVDKKLKKQKEREKAAK